MFVCLFICLFVFLFVCLIDCFILLFFLSLTTNWDSPFLFLLYALIFIIPIPYLFERCDHELNFQFKISQLNCPTIWPAFPFTKKWGNKAYNHKTQDLPFSSKKLQKSHSFSTEKSSSCLWFYSCASFKFASCHATKSKARVFHTYLRFVHTSSRFSLFAPHAKHPAPSLFTSLLSPPSSQLQITANHQM